MKKFKTIKSNKRFARQLKRALRVYNIKNFVKLNGYFIFSFSKASVVHFEIGNWKFGVWQDTKQVFSEHLGRIDKFKPSAVYFSNKYEDIDDIMEFIADVVIRTDSDGEEWIDDDNRRREDSKRIDLEMHQFIRNIYGVKDIELRYDKKNFFQPYSLHITLKDENIDENKVLDLMEDKFNFLMDKNEGMYYSKYTHIMNNWYDNIKFYDID